MPAPRVPVPAATGPEVHAAVELGASARNLDLNCSARSLAPPGFGPGGAKTGLASHRPIFVAHKIPRSIWGLDRARALEQGLNRSLKFTALLHASELLLEFLAEKQLHRGGAGHPGLLGNRLVGLNINLHPLGGASEVL